MWVTGLATRGGNAAMHTRVMPDANLFFLYTSVPRHAVCVVVSRHRTHNRTYTSAPHTLTTFRRLHHQPALWLATLLQITLPACSLARHPCADYITSLLFGSSSSEALLVVGSSGREVAAEVEDGLFELPLGERPCPLGSACWLSAL